MIEDNDDSAALRQIWRWNSWNYNTGRGCGFDFKIEDIESILPTDPYGGRAGDHGEYNQPGQNTVNLTSYIQSAIPGYSVVTGSDAEPLVLTFSMGSLANGLYYSHGYMELTLGDQNGQVDDPNKAPTDYVLVGDYRASCFNCDSTCDHPSGETSGTQHAWPTVCQQEFPHALCPPKQTFVRNALAVGALAYLDNNPCHCCTALPLDPERPYYPQQCTEDERTPDLPLGWQEPTNVHLSYFDGIEWRILREGMGGPGSYGDFRYGNYILWPYDETNTDEGYETVVLTIKTSTVDIYHKTKMVDWVDDQWVETWVESMAYDLPRHYTGNFNRLRAGTDESCRLLNSSYTCDPSWKNGQKLCKVTKEDRCDGESEFYHAKYVSFDNVKLVGGVGSGHQEPGACCKMDSSCEEIDEVACIALDGLYRGPMTECSQGICDGACCEPMFACTHTLVNACSGEFQGIGTSCATTTCPCHSPFADADWDGDVDQLDFGVFQACVTGAGGGILEGCSCFDRDNNGVGDDDVDQDDLDAFEECASGPDVLANPLCDD